MAIGCRHVKSAAHTELVEGLDAIATTSVMSPPHSPCCSTSWIASKRPISPREFDTYGKLRRWMIKFTDRPRYLQLKVEWRRWLAVRQLGSYTPPPLQRRPNHQEGRASFKHSGNAGDLVYALPALRELRRGRAARLFLRLNVPMRAALEHPLGGVQLNQQMYNRLEPLLTCQPYLSEVRVHAGEPVDYDLDVFRDSLLLLDRLGSCRWYFHMFGIAADLSQRWLHVDPDQTFSDCIVLARSKRYRNEFLDYTFLRSYRDVVFVGVRDEYEDMLRSVPNARWVQVKDFLELARIIAGSRLFIGNQSFPYSLAEALKVDRIVELDPLTPNVVPHGSNGYDVLFQRQFEYLVADRMSKTATRADLRQATLASG